MQAGPGLANPFLGGADTGVASKCNALGSVKIQFLHLGKELGGVSRSSPAGLCGDRNENKNCQERIEPLHVAIGLWADKKATSPRAMKLKRLIACRLANR